MDLYSRKIIAWVLAPTLEARYVVKAINLAKARRKTDQPLILHSDRGSQYVSQAYREATEKFQLSYSHKGYPFDNACIESFHALIKREWLNRFRIESYDRALPWSSSTSRLSTTPSEFTATVTICLRISLNASSRVSAMQPDRRGIWTTEQSFALPGYPPPQQLTRVNGVRSIGAALAIDACQILWYPPQILRNHLTLFCTKS